MKEILITNDDGFEARGLLELASALRSVANVTIVAPSSEKSACSHSLTLTRPLRFVKLDDGFFKLDDATPADCVYLALRALYNRKPDLVISGINHGANVAEDVTYSGTCGGAMEGPPKQFLNLNVPAVSKQDFKGLTVAPCGEKLYDTDAQLNRNPRGMEYYWLGKSTLSFDASKNENSDISVLFEGRATLSPIKLNLTAHEQMSALERWMKNDE